MNGFQRKKARFEKKILSKVTMLQGKRGAMNLVELYYAVLYLVLIGMIIGVGVLALDKFSTSSGVTATASTAINNTRVEIANISTNWMGLIVTIVILSLIIALVSRAFFGSIVGGGRG